MKDKQNTKTHTYVYDPFVIQLGGTIKMGVFNQGATVTNPRHSILIHSAAAEWTCCQTNGVKAHAQQSDFMANFSWQQSEAGI